MHRDLPNRPTEARKNGLQRGIGTNPISCVFWTGPSSFPEAVIFLFFGDVPPQEAKLELANCAHRGEISTFVLLPFCTFILTAIYLTFSSARVNNDERCSLNYTKFFILIYPLKGSKIIIYIDELQNDSKKLY